MMIMKKYWILSQKKKNWLKDYALPKPLGVGVDWYDAVEAMVIVNLEVLNASQWKRYFERYKVFKIENLQVELCYVLDIRDTKITAK